jgi:molybdopterin converting factor small subunit
VGVRVHIHKTQRAFTDGLDEVEVDGQTVGECLSELTVRFPEMKQALFTSKGELVNVIDVYVNHQSAYPEELAKAVTDGDEIQLVLLLAGG